GREGSLDGDIRDPVVPSDCGSCFLRLITHSPTDFKHIAVTAHGLDLPLNNGLARLASMGRVNLVPLQPPVTSPRDMALAAVICSALATVLLALFILCVIYCKRQLLEKKPVSLRSHEGPYVGSELSCLDRRVLEFSQRPCCHCRPGSGQSCGPVHLIPSLCFDDTWSQSRGRECRPFPSQRSLNEGLVNPSLGASQPDVGGAPDEAWPLFQTSSTTDDLQPETCSSCEEDEEREPQISGLSPAESEDGSNSRPLLQQLSTTEGEGCYRVKRIILVWNESEVTYRKVITGTNSNAALRFLGRFYLMVWKT
ncbi:hypothetical protein PO909_003439, partial [Leuciscus waleckii]